ncbi:MAG: AAA family ATPase [Candidatus Gottesmanbacteria bacterium]
MKRLIIGTVGLPGSGKTTIANYLSKQRFIVVRLSGFLEAEAKKKYGRINRLTLQDIGNEFRKKYGPSVLAELAIKQVKNKNRVVIDGIRNVAEIKFLKQQGSFYLVGINADPQIRYQRLLKIKAKALPKWEEFLRLDARDNGRGQSSSGLQVNKCLAKADTVIVHNSQDPQELYEKLDKLLKNIF